MLTRMWRKGNSYTLLVGNKLVQPLWKTVWRFLKKLKIELPYDPAIPLLGIYQKKKETMIQKDTCTPTFTEALFAIARIWKQPKCPSIDEWIKMSYICIYIYISAHTMEYYSALKKNHLSSLCLNSFSSSVWKMLKIIVSMSQSFSED